MTVSTIHNCREGPDPLQPLICLITGLSVGPQLLLPGLQERESEGETVKSCSSSDGGVYGIVYIL